MLQMNMTNEKKTYGVVGPPFQGTQTYRVEDSLQEKIAKGNKLTEWQIRRWRMLKRTTHVRKQTATLLRSTATLEYKS